MIMLEYVTRCRLLHDDYRNDVAKCYASNGEGIKITNFAASWQCLNSPRS